MRQMTFRTIGLFLVLLGAWGGIVSYIGPSFDYTMGSESGWNWTTANWQLHLVPGAAVVLAGLMLIVAAGRRATNRLACLLALAGGAWLVLGPLFASMWLGADAAETTIASSTLDQVARPLGYHYGTGLLIVAFAAYALGRRLVVGSYGPYPSDDRLATRGAAVTDDTPAAHVTPTD